MLEDCLLCCHVQIHSNFKHSIHKEILKRLGQSSVIAVNKPVEAFNLS